MVADPQELLDLARTVEARAALAKSTIDDLGKRLGAATWAGTAANRFRVNFDRLAATIDNDAADLVQLANVLRRQADELTLELNDIRGIETQVRTWIAANPQLPP